MSFYGSSFSFDGVSCEEYGLMLYDFGSTTHGNSEYAKVDIQEDRIPRRTRSLFYGTSYEEPLEFKLVFGAKEEVLWLDEPIDRQEMEVIASWLTGHQEYKWLMIDEFGFESIRYRCIITDLKLVEVDMYKWGFECTVHCDSPYGYTLPETFTFDVNGTRDDIVLRSRSSINTPYYPKVSFENHGQLDVVALSLQVGGMDFATGSLILTADYSLLTSQHGGVLYCAGLDPKKVRGASCFDGFLSILYAEDPDLSGYAYAVFFKNENNTCSVVQSMNEVSMAANMHDWQITNNSLKNETFKLFKAHGDSFFVDGETGVLKSSSDINIYNGFNFVFPRLVRGENHLTITGNGTVTFTCEFPVNVGG